MQHMLTTPRGAAVDIQYAKVRVVPLHDIQKIFTGVQQTVTRDHKLHKTPWLDIQPNACLSDRT